MCHIAANDINVPGKPVGVVGFNQKQLISRVITLCNKIIKIHRWETSLTLSEWSRFPLRVWKTPMLLHNSNTKPDRVPVLHFCSFYVSHCRECHNCTWKINRGDLNRSRTLDFSCPNTVQQNNKNPSMGNASNTHRMVSFSTRYLGNPGIATQ